MKRFHAHIKLLCCALWEHGGLLLSLSCQSQSEVSSAFPVLSPWVLLHHHTDLKCLSSEGFSVFALEMFSVTSEP